jgi:fumarate hydratase class II
MEYRIEHDTLGEVKVPKDVYFGAQTQRAVENFPISGLRLPGAFVRAQAIIKLAAARANVAAGRLDPALGEALVEAARDVMAGRYADQFVADVFGAGAGTSHNMNMNEVLANLATERLGGVRGDYSRVHPNDHVNMGQSTNDTIHVAIHIAGLCEIRGKLLPAMVRMEAALRRKAEQFAAVVKAGRTHLQDALPMRLGQEFGAWAAMIEKDRARIERAADGLLEINIGGTAVGTGMNTDPHFIERAAALIRELTGYPFRPAEDYFEATQALDAVVETAGALRVLVTSLKKISDDLRLLASGPRTGLAEIRLPAIQPGSSIMPGKVNPAAPEMMNMVCFQAMGCDATIVLAAQAGQLELNVMMPVIAYNFLLEIAILATGIERLTALCIEGIEADEARCRAYAERSPSVATALAPVIGYEAAAALAKEALDRNVLVRDLVREKGLLSDEQIDSLLDLDRMSAPVSGHDNARKSQEGDRSQETGVRS